MVKKVLKGLSARFGIEITKRAPHPFKDKVVSLQPNGSHRGNVLLSYRIEAFLVEEGDPLLQTHTNYWESYQIARTFLDLGYSVDAIDFRNRVFSPQKAYAFFVGARTNFDRIAPLLNRDCIKIVHLDTAQWLFNNHASYRRSLDLQQRRGVTIMEQSQRIIEPNLALEHADAATLLGNDFTEGTYRYAGKPLYRVPISTCALYPWPEDKDFEACKKRFLWFGSGGFVHKGLDRVLEAFADMPDIELTVCGPIHKERDFERLYHKELFETPHIRTVGWVDTESNRFTEILQSCVSLIYPSCSEGQCGAVVNCLHGGLIPIISYESGVDVGEYGMLLADCSVDSIKTAARAISALPAAKLREMSRNAWRFARLKHTRERFAGAYKQAIKDIIASRKIEI